MLSLGVKGVNGEGKGEVKNEFERGKSVFLLPSLPLPPTSPSSSISTPPLPLPHFTPAMQANGPREKNIPTFYNFFFLHFASLSVASFSICRSLLCQPHDDFVFKKRGPVTMKGKPEPMITYILQRKEGE